MTLAAGGVLFSLWAGLAFAQGARPGKPEVTASADIKQLHFDWEPVPRAGFYQLLRRQDDRPYYHPIGAPLLASTTATSQRVAVHLLDWANVRYAVAACNWSGCRTSDPIGVQEQMLPAIGYIKGEVTDENQQLGMQMVLSANGRTLAAMRQAPWPDDSCCFRQVMIFRRVAGEWRQEAAVSAIEGGGFADPLAISDDGKTLVVGAPYEPPAEDAGDFAWTAGSVYVFTRVAGQWGMNARVRLPETTPPSNFGFIVGISGDGQTLYAQASRTEQVHFFNRAADGWHPAEVLDSPDPYCASLALSGNAQVLVADCSSPSEGRRTHILERAAGQWSIVQTLALAQHGLLKPSPLSIDHTGDTIAIVDSVEFDYKVAVFKRSAGVWARETELMSFFRPSEYYPAVPGYADSVRLSADGRTLAVSDPTDSTLGTGVLQSPGPAGAQHSGSVYVYRRTNSGWQLRSFVKAPNAEATDLFGRAIGISHNGRTLAVSAIGEGSAATGISGDQSNNDAPYAGALYLY